jgi:hypothetical protein
MLQDVYLLLLLGSIKHIISFEFVMLHIYQGLYTKFDIYIT